jgi:uncharacterized protein DUF6049
VRPVAAMAAVVMVALTMVFFSAVPAAAAPGGLRLVLTDMTPRVVTADGPSTLTVAGTLVNEGADPVTDLQVRVQRGNPLTTEGQVRDALDGDAPTDSAVPAFEPLADALAPGAQMPVHLSVPLRGSGLALDAAGVYELLVNVNGTPAGGARARLAAARMLLPMLGVPGAAPTRPRADPTPLTVLYPIADSPHRISTVPGAPPLLDDDSLAASFAPTGRLGGLVAALAQRAPAGSPVRSGLCLAIDPDLVETASVMSQGYQVVGRSGVATAGTGAAVAGQWLTQLAAVAKGGCVIALPYADADLVALTRGGLTDAATRALGPARQILSTLLQTPVPADIAWPADGTIDNATLDVVQASGARSVLLSADAVTGRARGGVGPLADRPVSALLTDPLLTRAATAPQAIRVAGGQGAAATAESLAGDDGPLATQDLIGALAYRATASTPLVLAPPHQWRTDGAAARALLDAVGALVTAGEVNPVGLADADAVRSAAAPVRPDPPVNATEVPDSAISTIADAARDLTDLRSAVVDGNVGITADQLFTPLQFGLLRGASAANRAAPAAAQDAAAAVLARVDAIRNSIRVLEPPNPYALGSSDAPLPITVANALPVTVRVRVELASTSGLRVNAIDVQQIPPLGRRQVSVNAQVTRAGQFTVDAAVRTPSGGLLGPPSHLKVRSTAYGTITGWLTAIAGGLLVLLAGRRVWRRVRGEAERPTARVAPTPPPTVDPTGPTVRLPIPCHGPAPPDRMSAPPDRVPTDGRPTAPLDRVTAPPDPPSGPPGPASPDRAPAPAQAGLPTEPGPAPPPHPQPTPVRAPARTPGSGPPSSTTSVPAPATPGGLPAQPLPGPDPRLTSVPHPPPHRPGSQGPPSARPPTTHPQAPPSAHPTTTQAPPSARPALTQPPDPTSAAPPLPTPPRTTPPLVAAEEDVAPTERLPRPPSPRPRP